MQDNSPRVWISDDCRARDSSLRARPPPIGECAHGIDPSPAKAGRTHPSRVTSSEMQPNDENIQILQRVR